LSLSALFAICASRCMSVSNSLSLHDALPISPKRISKNGEESVVKLTRSFVENGLTVQEIRDLEIESDVFIELLDLGFLRQNHKGDRKSTRLNSSHVSSSYAVVCLRKKQKQEK